MLLLMGLFSVFISQATATTPTGYKSVDREMRAYVDYAAEFLGFPENAFLTHVGRTKGWAAQSLVFMGDSSFYVVVFDREFAETQPQHIKKALAGHEVGHSHPSCEKAFYDYYHDHGTYLKSENCADMVSSIVFGFESMYKALIEIKRTMPDAEDIDERIRLLYSQLSPEALEKKSREVEKEDKGLTAYP